MRLIAKHNHGEEIVAITDDFGEIIHFFVARPERLNLGETLTGLIRKKNATLKGYFVETDKGSVFVRIQEPHTEGERVCIKITKEARLGKDANGIFISQKEPEKSLTQTLSERYAQPVLYEWDETYDEALENALSETIPFADGAQIHIVRTPACWTIDVDSGACDTPTTELNRMATRIIVRELSLRHIGGLILIDFIGAKHRSERIALQKYLTELLEKDNLSTIMGWTRGGLFEIRRTRTYSPLIDVFFNDKGQLNTLSIAYHICALSDKCKGVPHITAHPKIIELLREKLNNTAILLPDITFSYTDFNIKETK